MQNKYIKTWLFVFVATLTVTSGAASFYAQNKTFYKGLEPQQWNFAKASTLTIGENAAVPTNVPKFLPAAQSSPMPTAPTIEPPKMETKIVAEIEPVLSPCKAEGIPVIKNGQIQRCTGAAPVISLASKPAPKIKIVELQAPPSCESQGRFTYTGEDQPGLLYGMCIDCLTTQFVRNGSKCK